MFKMFFRKILFFILLSKSASGVIGVDAATNSSVSASSLTWSHACSGTNRVLVVGFTYGSTTETITDVTYNGVSYSGINSNATGSRTTAIVRFVNPAAGTANIVITLSGSALIVAGAVSFTGNNNSSINGFSGASVSSSANPSASYGVATAGEYVIDVLSTDDQQPSAVGANQTEQVNILATHGLAMSTEPFDATSTSPIPMSWTMAADNSHHYGWILNVQTSALPIELYSFSADCNNERVEVKWITASEINNDFFTVERSTDGKMFESVVTVPGAGSNNTLLYYEINDDNPLPGISYYRLKQTDYDGKVEYFASTALKHCDSPSEKVSARLFMERENQHLLFYTLPEDSRIRIDLFNVTGEKVRSITDRYHRAGSYQLLLFPYDVELARGIYWLRVLGCSDKVTIPLILN